MASANVAATGQLMLLAARTQASGGVVFDDRMLKVLGGLCDSVPVGLAPEYF